MRCLVMPSPLGDYRYCGTVVLMSSTDTITLLVVLALGLSSSGFSSSELSSSEGAGTGLTSPVSTGTG